MVGWSGVRGGSAVGIRPISHYQRGRKIGNLRPILGMALFLG